MWNVDKETPMMETAVAKVRGISLISFWVSNAQRNKQLFSTAALGHKPQLRGHTPARLTENRLWNVDKETPMLETAVAKVRGISLISFWVSNAQRNKQLFSTAALGSKPQLTGRLCNAWLTLGMRHCLQMRFPLISERQVCSTVL